MASKHPEIKTKHSEISKYWLDKIISKRGKVYDSIIEAFEANDNIDIVEVVEHIIKPHCWACNKLIPNNNKVLEQLYKKYRMSEDSEGDLDGFLNDKETTNDLDKCYILAKSLGGEDTPENLFLLCSNCHAESPDTSNPETFIRWIFNRRREYWFGIPYLAVKNGIEKELEQRGIELTLAEISEKVEYNQDEYDEFYANNSSAYKEKKYSNLPLSTIIGVTTDYFLMKLESLDKENNTNNE